MVKMVFGKIYKWIRKFGLSKKTGSYDFDKDVFYENKLDTEKKENDANFTDILDRIKRTGSAKGLEGVTRLNLVKCLGLIEAEKVLNYGVSFCDAYLTYENFVHHFKSAPFKDVMRQIKLAEKNPLYCDYVPNYYSKLLEGIVGLDKKTSDSGIFRLTE